MTTSSLFPTTPPPGEASSLEGTLERIVFASPESAWCVVRLKVRGQRQLVTAVGPLFGLQPGESVRLNGRWVEDPKYGQQFRAETYLTLKPATVAAMERYLGSGLIQGIGRVMAKRLVERFALDTLDVIEHHPERLTEVPGIGAVRSRRICKAWLEQREIQQVMLFLQEHEVPTHFAVKIYRRYGNDALRVVRENPYRLATDVWGIGFKTADQIAARLGIPRDAPQRAAAGLLHTLSQAADQGHVYLPRKVLLERANELLEIPEPNLAEALSSLCSEEQAIAESLPARDEAVFLRSLYLSERALAARLLQLRDAPGKPPLAEPERVVREWEKHQGLELAPAQRRAVECALVGKVTVVTGGPGTGKTTLVRALFDLFTREGQKVLLAAPTGRAAKRLQEATGGDAVTLHRLLEFSPQSWSFERNAEHPLSLDALVVDEVSMVDTVLAHHLLQALPPQARLVLVGDADQLPSVGPGSVLADLLTSGAVESVRLSEVFRQARQSLIVTNAHRVLHGELPRLPADRQPSDFFFIERNDPEAALATLQQLVAQRIPRRFGFDPYRDIQVLTPMRRGSLGTHQLNTTLQQLLNADGRPVGPPHRHLRLGDKVMQVRNDYQLEVFNGDLGRIEAWDEEEGEILVRVDERLVRYDARDLDALELAYACSIHKSQGSEYPCVVLLLHGQHYVMLQRNLLYTGLTRGKRLVVLVGSRRAIATAVANDAIQQRYTALAPRLRSADS